MQFCSNKLEKIAHFFLLLFLSTISFSQYQFYAHLRGEGKKGVQETINENSIGQYSDNTRYSDQIWKYSIKKNEWMFLKGRRNNDEFQSPFFSNTHIFQEEINIGSRTLGKGWKENDQSHIFTFFGGNAIFGNNSRLFATNEVYRYNASSNSYAVIFCNNCGLNSITHTAASIEDPIDFHSQNYPKGRFDFETIKINEDEVLIIGGKSEENDPSGGEHWMDDWWLYSNHKMQFKYLGGNISYTTPLVYQKANVYQPGNSFGSAFGHRGVKINEEEVLFFGGKKNIDPDNSCDCSIVQKFNISSHMWKYISGNDNIQSTTSREFSSTNIPPPRNRHQLFKINENELLMTFGISETRVAFFYSNDQWRFNINENLWKFSGKEITSSTNTHSSFFGDDFAEQTIPGGILSYGIFFEESNDIFMCTGYGYGDPNNFPDLPGPLNDCWRLYLGNICHSKPDFDPSVCSGNGECSNFDHCECKDNYGGLECDIPECFGILANETEVCSKMGECSMNFVCSCEDPQFYRNHDCSINGSKKFIYDNAIILVIAFVVIVSAVIAVSAVITFFIFIITKQKKELKKLDQIEDVDIILQEQKMSKDNSVAKFKMHKKFFEIDPKDVDVIEKIGEGGGSGIVLLAKWNKLKVGYKCFEVKEFLNENKFEEFEKEVQMLSSINFPFVLTFYGATLSTQRLGFVMEFAENGDLENFLTQLSSKGKIQNALRNFISNVIHPQ